jgi:hypothetical protein
MSIATLTRPADDFDEWESEFTADTTESTTYRPSRAAERRADREAIDRGMGIYRHRTGERREV